MTDGPTPIGDLLDVARKYTAEDWEKAAWNSADQHIDQACRHLADLRRNDPAPGRI
jgi:hypothetical protein